MEKYIKMVNTPTGSLQQILIYVVFGWGSKQAEDGFDESTNMGEWEGSVALSSCKSHLKALEICWFESAT